METSTVNASSTSKSNSTQNNSNININSNNNNNNNNTSLNHNNEDNLQSHHLIINSKMSVSNSINNFSNNINNGNNQTHINSSTATKNKIINCVQHFPNIHSIEQIPREDLKLDEIELDVSVIINRILNEVEEENLLKVTADNNNANLPQELPLQNVNVATSMQEQGSYRDNDSGLDSTQLDQNSLDLSPDDGSCDLVIDSNLPSDDMQEPINQTDQQQQQQQQLNEKFPVEDQESKDTDKIAPDTVRTIITIESIVASNTAQDAPKQDSEFKDIAKVEMLNGPHLQNDNAPTLISINDRHPGEQKQISPEADFEAIKKHSPLEEAKLKDSLEGVAKLDGIVSEITKVDDLTDVQEDKAKDMVTLKNLEISPPPPAEGAEKVNEEKIEEETKLGKSSTKKQPNKRKRNDNSGSVSERCESTESGSRSKRQRTQTKLFQAGDAKSYEEPTSLSSSTKTKPSTRPAARNRKKSTTSSKSDANLLTAQDNIIQDTTTDLQDVIFYEKNDYLAIRNEEDSFFLCQLAETVRVKRPLLKVRWLDTKNGCQTYFLTSQYDKVPRKSIIVPVSLNKLKSEKKGEQTFTLSDHDRINIEERLKRSLNAQSECGSSQEPSTDN